MVGRAGALMCVAVFLTLTSGLVRSQDPPATPPQTLPTLTPAKLQEQLGRLWVELEQDEPGFSKQFEAAKPRTAWVEYAYDADTKQGTAILRATLRPGVSEEDKAKLVEATKNKARSLIGGNVVGGPPALLENEAAEALDLRVEFDVAAARVLDDREPTVDELLEAAQSEPSEFVKSTTAPETAVPTNLEAGRYMYGVGYHSYWSGRTEAAREALRSAAGYNPQDPRIWYYLGLTELRAMDRQAALDSFAQALRTDAAGRNARYEVAHSLERVQGTLRLSLEEARRRAANPAAAPSATPAASPAPKEQPES